MPAGFNMQEITVIFKAIDQTTKTLKNIDKNITKIHKNLTTINKKISATTKTTTHFATQTRKQFKSVLDYLRRFPYEWLSIMFFAWRARAAIEGFARSSIRAFLDIAESAGYLGSNITKLTAWWTYLRFEVGKAIDAALAPLLPYITRIIQYFVDLVQTHPEEVFWALAAGIAATNLLDFTANLVLTAAGVVVLISKLKKLKDLLTLEWWLNLGKNLLKAFGFVAGGIVLILTAWKLLKQNWEDWSVESILEKLNLIAGAFIGLTTIALSAGASIPVALGIGALGAMLVAGYILYKGFSKLFDDLFEWLKQKVSDLGLKIIFYFVDAMLSGLTMTGFLAPIFGPIQQAWRKAYGEEILGAKYIGGPIVPPIFAQIEEGTKSASESLKEVVKNTMSDTAKEINSIINQTMQEAFQIKYTAGGGTEIGAVVTTIPEEIQIQSEDIKNQLQESYGSITEQIKENMAGMWQEIVNEAQSYGFSLSGLGPEGSYFLSHGLLSFDISQYTFEAEVVPIETLMQGAQAVVNAINAAGANWIIAKLNKEEEDFIITITYAVKAVVSIKKWDLEYISPSGIGSTIMNIASSLFGSKGSVKSVSLKAYQRGTWFVPETGIYLLHKGEAVTPSYHTSFGNINVYVNSSNANPKEIADAIMRELKSHVYIGRIAR